MSRKMPLITVCMLVYNTREYLHRAIDSVIEQTYKNIEFVIVDDNSTDGSLDILKEYAKKDKRIKLIEHKINTGQPKARIDAIANSNGDYICFVDSDDWIEKDYLEKLYSATNSGKKDIAWANCVFEYDGKSENFEHHQNQDLQTNYEIMKLAIRTPNIWMGMFKRSLFEGVDWEKSIGSNVEDALVVVQLAARAKSAFALNYFGYHYRQRESSGTNFSNNRDTQGDLALSFSHYEEIIRLNQPTLFDDFIYYVIGYMLNIIPLVVSKKNIITFMRLKKLSLKYLKFILNEKRIPFRIRIYSLATALLPYGFVRGAYIVLSAMKFGSDSAEKRYRYFE